MLLYTVAWEERWTNVENYHLHAPSPLKTCQSNETDNLVTSRVMLAHVCVHCLEIKLSVNKIT